MRAIDIHKRRQENEERYNRLSNTEKILANDYAFKQFELKVKDRVPPSNILHFLENTVPSTKKK